MEMDYDVFVSYACEDRDEVVGPLVLALQECGLRVWWDKTALRVGDSLTETIDHGLAHSRRGIVVLSPAFFGKSWTRRELEGLVMRQMGGERVILPVWHRVSTAEVRAFSLPLANIVAVNTKEGLDAVAASILAAIDPATPSIPQAGGVPPRRWATTTLKFYGNFFLIAVSSTLIGCSYPLMSNNLPIKKEFIIILYLVVILAMMARLLRPSWTEFTERRNLDYRRDVMAALVFAFFLVILNSGIFLMLSTNLPIYSLFSDTDGMTSAIEWTFIINCSIATIAVAVYCFVYWGLAQRYGKDVATFPLWSSTLLLSLVPTSGCFLLVLYVAEQGFATYVFIALFPFIISLLALQGYSHPRNALDTWTARFLLTAAAASCFLASSWQHWGCSDISRMCLHHQRDSRRSSRIPGPRGSRCRLILLHAGRKGLLGWC